MSISRHNMFPMNMHSSQRTQMAQARRFLSARDGLGELRRSLRSSPSARTPFWTIQPMAFGVYGTPIHCVAPQYK